MRILTTLLLAITLTACAATTAVPTSEAGKALEAEQLVRYSLTGRIMESVENNYSEQLGSLLTSLEVPAEQEEQIITEVFTLCLLGFQIPRFTFLEYVWRCT